MKAWATVSVIYCFAVQPKAQCFKTSLCVDLVKLGSLSLVLVSLLWLWSDSGWDIKVSHYTAGAWFVMAGIDDRLFMCLHKVFPNG